MIEYGYWGNISTYIMTSAHFLYIPIIFSLGLLVGTLLRSSSDISIQHSQKQTSIFLRGRTLFGSFLIFIAFFIGTHFFNVPGSSKAVSTALHGAEIFDKSPSFTSGDVYSRIHSFPIDGIALYKQFTYTIDILFPLTLFAFLILLSLYITNRLLLPRRIKLTLLLIPIVWFVSDMVENATIYYLLSTFPSRHDVLANMLGYLTITKFSLLLLSIAIPTLLRVFEHDLKRKDHAYTLSEEIVPTTAT